MENPSADPTPHTRRVHVTEALVRRHQVAVWRYLRFLGSPAASADDLSQEVFLVLLGSNLRERGDAALSGWLRGVARNLYLAGRRGVGSGLREGLELFDEEQLESAWARFAGEDAGDAYHAALDVCLETLSEKERRALALRFAEEAGRNEMASALGVSGEGVKSLLRRAKNKLRLCINGRLENG